MIHEGFGSSIRIVNYLVIDDELYMFFQKNNGMLVQEELYYYKINTKTAELEKETKIVNSENLNSGDKFRYFTHFIYKEFDKIIIRSWVDFEKPIISVFDEYFKEIEIKSLNSRDEEIEFLADLQEIEKDKFVNVKINRKQKNPDVLKLNVQSTLANEIVTEKNIEIKPHPNMSEKFISKMKIKYTQVDHKELEDNSKITVLTLDVNPTEYISEGVHNEYRYYVIVKTNPIGEIQFIKDIAVRGPKNNYYNKFFFNADENQINIVFMNNLDKVTRKNSLYHGNYIEAKVIDNDGEYIVEKIWEGFQANGTKIYYVFQDGVVQDVNTFSCHVYKKKKEDLVLRVVFND